MNCVLVTSLTYVNTYVISLGPTDGDDDNAGVIIGVVVGGIIAIIVIFVPLIIVYYYCKKYKKKRKPGKCINCYLLLFCLHMFVSYVKYVQSSAGSIISNSLAWLCPYILYVHI